MGSLGPAEFGEDFLALPELPADLQPEVALLTPQHFWSVETAKRRQGFADILEGLRDREQLYGPPAAATAELHQSFYRFLGSEVIQHGVLAVRRYPRIGTCHHLLFNELMHDPFEDEERLRYLEFTLHDTRPLALMQSGEAVRTRSEAWLSPVLGTCALLHWEAVDKKFTVYRGSENKCPKFTSDRADLGADLDSFRQKIGEALQLLTMDNWELGAKGYFV